jgi:hypothetical protein
MCRSITERSAQEMLNSSDGIISQYTSAFQQLKERFAMRSGLVTLKVLRNVKQGVVQLSSTLVDLKDMGKTLLDYRSDFICICSSSRTL